MSSPLLLSLLVGLVALLWKLERHPAAGRLFRILPVPFWCYFLPMAGTTLGWIPAASPLYPFLSQQLLPVCLVLLLIGTDLPALAKLGPRATLLMLAGAAGTVLGGLVGFFLYRDRLPEGSWGAVGALAGSWTGGSANLLAVKEALQVPDALIAPVILVDAAIAYSWMGLLIWSSALADRWERLLQRGSPVPAGHRSAGPSVAGLRSVLRPRSSPDSSAQGTPCPRGLRNVPDQASGPHVENYSARLTGRVTAFIVIAVSITISLMAQQVGDRLPALGVGMGASAWTVLIVTSVALILSLTPLRKVGGAGTSRAGTFALYVLLTSIGARANLNAVAEAPAFLLLGLSWIAIHGTVLLLAGFWMRAPLGLIATASQANIGGVVSAPLVGAAFSPQLAAVGLLMAILGNVIGTYVGMVTAGLACSLLTAPAR